jgi:ASC-1-like (ASCH) protein
MDHLAFMGGKWLDEILAGRKTCETRWYKNRIPPMVENRQYPSGIVPGECIYFKKSGKPVTAKAIVDRVEFFEDLESSTIERILSTYESQMGFGREMFDEFKDKRYCILIFLKSVKAIDPFEINKAGYGSGSAWITLEDIEEIRK